MDQILEFLKTNPTYFLATVDAQGNPQLRPFGTIARFDGGLYIQTGRSKAVYQQIKDHSRVAISGMGEVAADTAVEAAKKGPFTSLGDFRTRTKVSQTLIDLMVNLHILDKLPKEDQFSFFDSLM